MEWSLGSFGDLRLNREGGEIFKRMVTRKTVCLRRLGGNRGGELRAGRFFASTKVTSEKLVAGWSDQTGAACAGRHVLAIQDTTEVKFPTTAQRRRGLGPVKKGNAFGLLVHAMVAVDAETGSCLGLVGGDVWSRDGVNPTPHRKRSFADRESVRWVDAAQQAKRVLALAAMVTVVGDREADIYPAWGSVPAANIHLLTRAMSDRSLKGGGLLFAAADGFPAAGQRKIELPARDPGQPKRTAVVEMRYGEVEICRPRGEQDRSLPATVRLRLVEVQEIEPPEGEEPLHWRLLTTHELSDTAGAWRIVRWYQLRWVIEHLFRVMKSQGLQLEDSQLATADRLVKLAAAATKAACVDIQLTQGRPRLRRGRLAPTKCRRPTCSASRRSTPSPCLVRRWKARPSGSRTRIRREALPGRRGSSPGWVVGIATTSRRDQSPSGAAWSIFTRSTEVGNLR